MSYLSRREQCLQLKIKGQSRPFIDEALQIQVPSQEHRERQNFQSYAHIYAHYLDQSNSSIPSITHINEQQLQTIMTQIQHSYQAWTKMQKIIQDKINNFSNI